MLNSVFRRYWLLSVTVFFLLSGCGFHLRGKFAVPKSLQVLQILPAQSFPALQRPLKQILKSNGVIIVADQNVAQGKPATLTLLNESSAERTIAYGSDAQPNRAILQLTVTYQLTDPLGKPLISEGAVLVERELTLTPNAILGTDNERKRLQSDLYWEAASQLTRQLTALSDANSQ